MPINEPLRRLGRTTGEHRILVLALIRKREPLHHRQSRQVLQVRLMGLEEIAEGLPGRFRVDSNRGVRRDSFKDRVHQFDDRRTRSEGTLQRLLDEFDLSVVGDRLQLLENPWITTPPSIDRLLHVAHDEERPTPVGDAGDLAGDRTHRPPLRRGGVLELVEQKMLDPRIDAVPEFLERPGTDPTPKRIERPREIIELRQADGVV